MSTFDKKKKDMAKKMDINMGSASKAASHIPNSLKRGTSLDDVGKNSHKKDTIKGVGSMKNSNRSMP